MPCTRRRRAPTSTDSCLEPGRSSVPRSPSARCSPACSSGGTRPPPSSATRTPRRSTLAVWVSVALTVVHLVASALVMREPRPHVGSERTRLSHALSEARRRRPSSRAACCCSAATGCSWASSLAEVFWSIGMITFESFMPLRLEEMVGSAQEAGALVGPVSAAGWGLFSVGAWLAGHDLHPRRGRPRRDPGPGAQRRRRDRHGSGHRPRRPHRGLPVHLLDARHERPAARGTAAPRGRGEEPLDRAVDQLDDGLPGLRRRRARSSA